MEYLAIGIASALISYTATVALGSAIFNLNFWDTFTWSVLWKKDDEP